MGVFECGRENESGSRSSSAALWSFFQHVLVGLSYGVVFAHREQRAQRARHHVLGGAAGQDLGPAATAAARALLTSGQDFCSKPM